MRSDCALLGIDPDRLIPPQQQRERPDDFELWPEHQEAWNVYLGCATQWRVAVGMGGAYWEGLNYSSVEIVMNRYGVPESMKNKVFSDVQIMEDEEKQIRNWN